MRPILWLVLFISIVSCESSTRISSIENKSLKVKGNEISSKSEIESFLNPYRKELARKMNDTLAYSEQELTKKKNRKYPRKLGSGWYALVHKN